MNPTPRTGTYPQRVTEGVGDLDLIRRIGAGDEGALGALYDRWCGVVSALVSRVVRDADDIDDVVEEIFWQVWRQASRYDESRGSVQTWLATIARTRALDRLAAARRRREEPLERETDEARVLPFALATESSSDPSLDAEHADQRRIVLAALANLPLEQRTTLELAYYNGLSQSEIATQTGEPLGTVKTRMRLAMRKLRDTLHVLREGAR